MKYYFILLAVHLFFFIFLFDPFIRSDGVLFFWSTHSMIIDGDLDFSNQFNDLPLAWMDVESKTSTGLVFNVQNFGSSLMNSPLFLFAHAISILGNFETSGYSILYTFFFNLGSVIYSFFGSVIIFHTLTKYFKYKKSDSLFATLLIVLATPVLVYSLANTSFSSAHTFFAVSLFILIWVKFRNENSIRYWIFIGLCAGLIFMIRTVDAVFVLLPIIDVVLFKRKEYKKNFKKIGYIGIYALFFIVAFSPHIFYWQILYGEPIPTPMPLDQWYIIHDDPRGTFMNWTNPHFMEFFFSEHRGLFTWNPIFLLGVIGFYFLYKKHPQFAILAVIMSALMFYLHAAPNDWWGGGSFGQRRAADIAPFLAIGLAALLNRLAENTISKISKGIILSSSIIWNVLFFLIFKWEHLARVIPLQFYSDVFPHLVTPQFYILNQIQRSFILYRTKVMISDFGIHLDQIIWLAILSIPSIILLFIAFYTDIRKKLKQNAS